MARKKKGQEPEQTVNEDVEPVQAEEAVQPEEPETGSGTERAAPGETAAREATPKETVPKENFLRLAAEYDNFRKRTQKEKDNLYTEIRAEIIGKLLPVYDNLERALHQETSYEAYKKGVEMTMAGLVEVMGKLGVESFGEAGEPFDPNIHNAVMHCEDESLGENVLAEVFQKGFRIGERVIRFAMVRVAN